MISIMITQHLPMKQKDFAPRGSVTCIGPEMALKPFLQQIFCSQDQRRAGTATLSVSCLIL